MKILVTGANGFIGSAIVSTLIKAGHEVVCCVRDTQRTQQQFPGQKIIPCDFNRDTDSATWEPRLDNIDAVVNCVGILQGSSAQSIEAIHHLTPNALFDACVKKNIRKIVHISAVGVDTNTKTLYATTKKSADTYLASLNLDAIILRPSLVYGRGSYGGTSLFRGLAALPFFIPIVGKGDQPFQPTHLDDLAKTVQQCLEKTISEKQLPADRVINVVGSENLTIAMMLVLLRQWLGFGKAKLIHIPMGIMNLLGRIGDFLRFKTINSTAMTMLTAGQLVNPEPYLNIVDFKPRKFSTELATTPSYVQDHWHARLYFLNPVLRVGLGLVWLLSGIIPLLFIPHQELYELFKQVHITNGWAVFFLYTSCFWNIGLGIAAIADWRLKIIGILQLITVVAYTITISIGMPSYWLHPFGPLLKNIAVFISTLIMLVISEDR